MEGEQGLAGGDAGAAVDDEPLGRCVAEEAFVLVAERFGRFEVPAVLDVLREGEVDRAGDVAGDGVDGLGLAAVPLPRRGLVVVVSDLLGPRDWQRRASSYAAARSPGGSFGGCDRLRSRTGIVITWRRFLRSR